MDRRECISLIPHFMGLYFTQPELALKEALPFSPEVSLNSYMRVKLKKNETSVVQFDRRAQNELMEV